MHILKSSTALALVLGLGVTMAGLPAYAAGEQTDVTTGTAADTGTEAAAGAQTGTGMAGDDEFVTSEQARSDAERQFDEIPDAEGGQDLFAQSTRTETARSVARSGSTGASRALPKRPEVLRARCQPRSMRRGSAARVNSAVAMPAPGSRA